MTGIDFSRDLSQIEERGQADLCTVGLTVDALTEATPEDLQALTTKLVFSRRLECLFSGGPTTFFRRSTMT